MRSIALLALLAGPALADCPVAGDLGGGISITYADGWKTLTTLTDRGTTLEVTSIEGAEDFFIEAEKGVHTVLEGPWRDGKPVSDQVTRHELIGGGTYPAVTPGMRWSGQIRSVSGDGSVQTGTQVMNAGAKTRITIGGCNYDAIPLHLAFRGNDDSGYTTALSYLQDLGVVVLTASGRTGDVYTEFFRATAISRAGPGEGTAQQ